MPCFFANKITLFQVNQPGNPLVQEFIVETRGKGLDWTGLDWTGLDWTGLDWTGLDWTGLDWTVPRSAILTVQNNVITRNPRIGVSHDGHSVWNLHIRWVDSKGRGLLVWPS